MEYNTDVKKNEPEPDKLILKDQSFLSLQDIREKHL